jgi:hypothetical protein
MTTKNPSSKKGRGDRGTTFLDRAGALHDPLITNSSKAIGSLCNVGLTAQTTRSVLRDQHNTNFHLSGSRGNFSWIQKDMGLSLAHIALSTSTSLLSSVIADAYLTNIIIAKKGGHVKRFLQVVLHQLDEISNNYREKQSNCYEGDLAFDKVSIIIFYSEGINGRTKGDVSPRRRK